MEGRHNLCFFGGAGEHRENLEMERKKWVVLDKSGRFSRRLDDGKTGSGLPPMRGRESAGEKQYAEKLDAKLY